jgi:hypothetical protein
MQAVALIISQTIRDKLDSKHGVTPEEVSQCFNNRTGNLLVDIREEHRTDPPTNWFIAFTNKGRLLKVCFIHKDGNQYVRSCFPPNEIELHIYRTKGKPSDF